MIETNEDDVINSLLSALRINEVSLPEPNYNLNFTRWDHQDFPGMLCSLVTFCPGPLSNLITVFVC